MDVRSSQGLQADRAWTSFPRDVLSASHEWVKETSSLAVFKVPVRPGEEVVVTYRVRSGY